MRGSYLKSFLMAATAVGLSVTMTSRAAVSVGAGGAGPLTFDTAPDPADFSTMTVAGGSGAPNSLATLDTAVNALTASGLNVALALSNSIPPAPPNAGPASDYAVDLMKLQTRPTGVAMAVIMMTLINSSGGPVDGFTLSYNLTAEMPVVEEVLGHAIYYSLTGAAGSWHRVTSLPPNNTTGLKSGAVNLASSWAAGSTMYVLWADDNGSGTPDTSLLIDDVAISNLVGPSAPVITTPPTGSSVNERATVVLSVVASGSDLSYQWFKGAATMVTDSAACVNGLSRSTAGATTPTLTITGIRPSEAGMYHVRVSNSLGMVNSADAAVAVAADHTAPKVLYATCGSNPNEFVVYFSEALDDSCDVIGGSGAVSSIFNWTVEDIGGTQLGVANFTNTGTFEGQTVLGLVTSIAHDPTKSTQISWLSDFTDTAQTPNTLPAGSVMALCYTNELLALGANWQYNDDDVDPGPTWKNLGFVDTGGPWSTGAGPFDSKRDGGIVGPDGLDDCRAMTLYGLGAVGTCLSQQSPVTMTNLITAYFRTHFNFSGNPASSVILLYGKFDDGAAVYLNGTEIWRIGLPPGPLTHTTLGGRGAAFGTAVGDGDPQDSSIVGAPASLVAGDNLLAVELHQQALTSSDLTMGLIVAQLVSEPPIILRIVNNGDGTVTLTWPGGGTLRSTTSITTPRPWPAVSGSPVSPYTTTHTGTQRFYDLSIP